MPICLAQIVWMMCICDVLLNPKYTGHVYKVTVAVDNLGNIVWICDLMPGKSADVAIWDQRGPSRMHGQFFDYEVGNTGLVVVQCVSCWLCCFAMLYRGGMGWVSLQCARSAHAVRTQCKHFALGLKIGFLHCLGSAKHSSFQFLTFDAISPFFPMPGAAEPRKLKTFSCTIISPNSCSFVLDVVATYAAQARLVTLQNQLLEGWDANGGGCMSWGFGGNLIKLFRVHLFFQTFFSGA